MAYSRNRVILILIVVIVSSVLILSIQNYYTLQETDEIKESTGEFSKIDVDYNNTASDGYVGMSLQANFQIFDKTSPWNTMIPESSKIDPNSHLMIENLISSLTDAGFKPSMSFAINQWTSPIHVINSEIATKIDVPTTNYFGRLYHSVDPDKNGVAEGVPMPEGIWQDPKSDGHMILVDPYKRLVWEFSQAKKLDDGSWEASIIDKWDLNGRGYREPFAGESWWRSGAVAAGAPFIAGIIRYEEIKAGEINHAVGVSTPINRLTISKDVPWDVEICSPIASRSDGWGIGPQYIPEGSRLQLNPDLDLDAMDLSNDAKTIATALQKYGAYVIMNGPNFALYFQNHGIDGGKWIEHLGIGDLEKIPLTEFRVLECNIATK